MFISDLSGSNPCVLPPPDICRTFTSELVPTVRRKSRGGEFVES